MNTRQAFRTVTVDRRFVALGDMLAAAAVAAHAPDGDKDAAATTMIAAAADVYAFALGYSGALDIPAGTRVPRRVAVVLAAAAGDDIPPAGRGRESESCR